MSSRVKVALASVATGTTLFVAQFILVGRVNNFDTSGLPLSQATAVQFNIPALVFGAVPVALLAFALARFLANWLPGASPTELRRGLLASWAAVWLCGVTALHVLFAGPSPSGWGVAFIQQPAVLYGLAAVFVGLYVGARRRRGA